MYLQHQASRFTLDSVSTEKNQLKDEFNVNFKIVLEVQDKEKENATKIGQMIDFLTKAWVLCDEIDKR